jgi:hypothetical protein
MIKIKMGVLNSTIHKILALNIESSRDWIDCYEVPFHMCPSLKVCVLGCTLKLHLIKAFNSKLLTFREKIWQVKLVNRTSGNSAII